MDASADGTIVAHGARQIYFYAQGDRCLRMHHKSAERYVDVRMQRDSFCAAIATIRTSYGYVVHGWIWYFGVDRSLCLCLYTLNRGDTAGEKEPMLSSRTVDGMQHECVFNIAVQQQKPGAMSQFMFRLFLRMMLGLGICVRHVQIIVNRVCVRSYF